MRRLLLPVLVLIPLLCLSQAVWAQAAKHFSNLKQITHGGQNAEAYWAPDGKRLIFQATRDTSECDQQYIMNADGSDMHMVSTGKGVTTCGYFLPDNKHILYASTHEAGPSCPARPDRSKGYLWAVYPGFDIYLADDKGKIDKKLTDTAGYDAEATINWKNEQDHLHLHGVRRPGFVDHEPGRFRQEADHQDRRL